MHLAKKFDCGVLSQYLAYCFTGVSNVEADRQSRTSQSQLEWTLNPKLFKESIHKLGVNPTNDLFCNTDKLPTATARVSYRSDPGAVAINAFNMSWKCYLFYAFPPFCLISRVLQKIQQEKSTGLLVVPKWPTQIWWPELMRILVSSPILLPKTQNTLCLPNSPETAHPFYPKLG